MQFINGTKQGIYNNGSNRVSRVLGFFVRIEAFSALHADLSCLHQLVDMLSGFKQRVVRETLGPSCASEKKRMKNPSSMNKILLVTFQNELCGVQADVVK